MEIILLILGAIMGLVSSLVVVPLLETRTQGILVKLLGSARVRKNLSFAGKWEERWWEEGVDKPQIVEDKEAIVDQFGKEISAKVKSKNNTIYVLGRIEDRFITGTWSSEFKGVSYHGAFQLHILPNGEQMEGKWIGFSKSNEIKCGCWEWKWPSVKKYPSDQVKAKQAFIGA